MLSAIVSDEDCMDGLSVGVTGISVPEALVSAPSTPGKRKELDCSFVGTPSKAARRRSRADRASATFGLFVFPLLFLPCIP